MKTTHLLLLFAALGSVRHVAAQDVAKSIKPIPVTRKVALVIGNSNYRFIPAVPPASADADDTAQALRGLHFDTVVVKKDLDADALIAEIGKFARSQVQAGDLAVVYYSGHGGQVGEENYLLPIDYQPPSEDDLVDRRAYKMSRVRDVIEHTGARVRLLIFDACRNSPVTTSKASTTGLRAMDGKPEGTLIAYASAHNQMARYDGSRNSFYTSELLGELRRSGTDLKAVLERVQNRVYERTSHQQTPYLYGFLSGPLYLAGAPANTPDVRTSGSPSTSDADPAREAWELSKTTKNRGMLEAIVREFPDSGYARLARVELAGMGGASPETKQRADNLYARGQAASDRKDYPAAFDLFMQAADLGHADAMKDVGRLYVEGWGVKQDRAEGFRWTSRAVEAGSAMAMNNLGIAYLNGIGLGKDAKKALEWFAKAADAGVTLAMINLATEYRTGGNVTVDSAEALRWYRKAADAGDPVGMYGVGDMYWGGVGVTKDTAEGFRWIRKSAESGNPTAMDALGRLYGWGDGVPKDYRESMRWFRKAADAGVASAMSGVGQLYNHGLGVMQDYSEAMRWFRNAADNGDVSAWNEIGILYWNGWGVEQNRVQATLLYRKAADAGDPGGMVNVAQDYENGWSVPKDLNKAIELYRTAADKGNDFAKAALERLGAPPRIRRR